MRDLQISVSCLIQLTIFHLSRLEVDLQFLNFYNSLFYVSFLLMFPLCNFTTKKIKNQIDNGVENPSFFCCSVNPRLDKHLKALISLTAKLIEEEHSCSTTRIGPTFLYHHPTLPSSYNCRMEKCMNFQTISSQAHYNK